MADVKMQDRSKLTLTNVTGQHVDRVFHGGSEVKSVCNAEDTRDMSSIHGL